MFACGEYTLVVVPLYVCLVVALGRAMKEQEN